MRAGELDRWISLERATENKDAEGAVTKSWATHLETWAEVREEKGKEAFQNGRDVGSRNALFFIRYEEDIQRTDRINYGGDIWDITSIREIGRMEGLEIAAGVTR